MKFPDNFGYVPECEKCDEPAWPFPDESLPLSPVRIVKGLCQRHQGMLPQDRPLPLPGGALDA